MAWHARLALQYERQGAADAPRTVARFLHEGPLRILQSLYPEGDATCHNVLVHPPSGLVAGDRLDVSIDAAPGTHGLVTTPGAGRFYRSEGERATQHVQVRMQGGARLEWLPMEAICYSGCNAENRLDLDLAPGAEFIGWDVTALGLPHSNQPFVAGRLRQHLEVAGGWLERGLIDAADTRLMDGPLGLAGRRCIATLFFAAGSDIGRARREQALAAAREVIEAHPLRPCAGATAPDGRVVAVRVLSDVVEPAMGLLRSVRHAWRAALWGLDPHPPRTWAL